MKLHNLLIAFITFFISCSHAQTNDELYSQLFKALDFAKRAKAPFKQDCQLTYKRLLIPALEKVCSKLKHIPDEAIETAALPYLKHHVSPDLAREAILFWESPNGKNLNKELIKGIETQNPTLYADDMKLFKKSHQTKYGKALLNFAKDKAHADAVSQVLLEYEPSTSVLKIGNPETNAINETAKTELDLGAEYIDNCQSLHNIEARVFHSMYKTEEEARTIYVEIINDKNNDKLPLLKKATSDSIDEASRVNKGDLGYIQLKNFAGNFANTIINLPLEELSSPTPTEYGWHLIWVVDVRNNETGLPCVHHGS
ncbi:MAG: peptidylprolyl isomerase [Methylophilaceae bacterium]